MSSILTTISAGHPASAIPVSPGARLAPPRLAVVAVPAQQRLRRWVRLHEAVERRWREAVALAAGLVARRYQRRRRGRNRAGEQQDGGDPPDHARCHSHILTSRTATHASYAGAMEMARFDRACRWRRFSAR